MLQTLHDQHDMIGNTKSRKTSLPTIIFTQFLDVHDPRPFTVARAAQKCGAGVVLVRGLPEDCTMQNFPLRRHTCTPEGDLEC